MWGMGQLAKRLDDHISSTNRAFDTVIGEQRAHAARSEDGIRDLSVQLRGQLGALQQSVETRHQENRNRMWLVAVSVGTVIIGAVASAYFAAHGFTTAADKTQVDAIKHLEDTLKGIQLENKMPVRPGLGG